MSNNNETTSTTSTQDKVSGTFDQAVGATKKFAGKILDDKEMQSEGSAQNASGKAEKFMGDVKSKIQEGTHALGDSIEKVGTKLQEKGFEKTGGMIHNAGDKIEHVTDKR